MHLYLTSSLYNDATFLAFILCSAVCLVPFVRDEILRSVPLYFFFHSFIIPILFQSYLLNTFPCVIYTQTIYVSYENNKSRRFVLSDTEIVHNNTTTTVKDHASFKQKPSKEYEHTTK